MSQDKKVMVFGVFDGLHDGHRALLRQAKKYGGYLIAVAAPDAAVIGLKNHPPRHPLAERLAQLRQEPEVDEVSAGDLTPSGWEVVKRHRPQVIAVGYDQQALRQDLEKHREELGYAPEIVILEPFEPENYHTSLLI